MKSRIVLANFALLIVLASGSSTSERKSGSPVLSTRLSARLLDPATLRELGMPATIAAGDRVLVPRSAFDTLRRKGVPPRGFRLANNADSSRQFFTEAAPTHCQEGVICAPAFVLEALGVKEGQDVLVSNCHLPKAEFVRFQAHSSKLAEHPEMETMLTSTLEGFAALTNGTTIELRDGPNVFKVDVIAVRGRPDRRADSSEGGAVWIDNIDLVTDWAPPKDAKLAARRKRAAGVAADEDDERAEADVPVATRGQSGMADATGAAAAADESGQLLSVDTYAQHGLSPIQAIVSMVQEDVRCDPLVRLLVLDRSVAVYVLLRTVRLLVNALRWAAALELLPPVGVSPKDPAAFKHDAPEPAELMACRLSWLAHAVRSVLLFALGMPTADAFAWPDAIKERSYGGRYGYLGGWSPPWLDGWPYKGVFPASWTGKGGERLWRHHRPIKTA